MKAACLLSDQWWQTKYMPGWNADWTTGAMANVAAIRSKDVVGVRDSSSKGEATSNAEAICDEWVDHPVLIVQRDTFANFFHDRFVAII